MALAASGQNSRRQDGDATRRKHTERLHRNTTMELFEDLFEQEMEYAYFWETHRQWFIHELRPVLVLSENNMRETAVLALMQRQPTRWVLFGLVARERW